MSKLCQKAAHDWMYADIKAERYPKSANCGYRRELFFSYASVIARKVIEKKKKYLTMNTDYKDFGATTSDHYRNVVDSISTQEWIIVHYHHSLSVDENLEIFNEELEELLFKNERAKTYSYKTEISQCKINIERYMELQKPDKRTKGYKELMKTINIDSKELALRLAKSTIKRREENKEKAENLKEMKIVSLRKDIKRFYKGYDLKDMPTAEVIASSKTVLIRRDKDSLVSSNYVKVEYRTAKQLYNRWSKGKDILGLELGPYTVVKSNKESVTIGCTTISAPMLDWAFKV